MFDGIAAVIGFVVVDVIPLFIQTVSEILSENEGPLTETARIFDALFTTILDGFDLVAAAWQEVLKPALTALVPALATSVVVAVGTAVAALELLSGAFKTTAAIIRGDFTTAWEEGSSTVDRLRVAMFGEPLDTFDILVDRWGKSGDELVANTETTWGDIGAFITTTSATTKTTILAAWDAIVVALEGSGVTIQAVWTPCDRCGGFLGGYQGRHSGRPRATGQRLEDLWTRITGAISNAWDGITDAISTKISSVTTAIADAFSSTVATVGRVF